MSFGGLTRWGHADINPPKSLSPTEIRTSRVERFFVTCPNDWRSSTAMTDGIWLSTRDCALQVKCSWPLEGSSDAAKEPRSLSQLAIAEFRRQDCTLHVEESRKDVVDRFDSLLRQAHQDTTSAQAAIVQGVRSASHCDVCLCLPSGRLSRREGEGFIYMQAETTKRPSLPPRWFIRSSPGERHTAWSENVFGRGGEKSTRTWSAIRRFDPRRPQSSFWNHRPRPMTNRSHCEKTKPAPTSIGGGTPQPRTQ
jgi:hypothetical protein